MAGYFMFHRARTEVDFCAIVEDIFCRLIITVEPELKLTKHLMWIASTSSPAIANTFVVCSSYFIGFLK